MSVGHVIGYENGHKDVGQAAGYENGQGLQSMNIGNHRQPNRYSISNDFLNSFEQLKIGTENKVDKVNEKTDAAENALNIHPFSNVVYFFNLFFYLFFLFSPPTEGRKQFKKQRPLPEEYDKLRQANNLPRHDRFEQCPYVCGQTIRYDLYEQHQIACLVACSQVLPEKAPENRLQGHLSNDEVHV